MSTAAMPPCCVGKFKSSKQNWLILIQWFELNMKSHWCWWKPHPLWDDTWIKHFMCSAIVMCCRKSADVYYVWYCIPWISCLYICQMRHRWCDKSLSAQQRQGIGIISHIFPTLVIYRNSFLIMKLSNLLSSRVFRALIASQSTFEK